MAKLWRSHTECRDDLAMENKGWRNNETKAVTLEFWSGMKQINEPRKVTIIWAIFHGFSVHYYVKIILLKMNTFIQKC
jgi:hypothetical protein